MASPRYACLVMIAPVVLCHNHNNVQVREALEFSARLRLRPASHVQRAAFVSEILHLLELAPIANRIVRSEIFPSFACDRYFLSATQVGVVGAANAISSGERKRLTIGVELMANAPVLFLDEPTSGKLTLPD